MKWNKKYIDPEGVRKAASVMGVDHLEASILLRREIDPESFIYFMEDDIRYLHNPFLFRQMTDVVDRSLAAVEEEEHVLICGDRDADGITSTVLLYEAFQYLGLEVEWRVPTGEDAYGLSAEVIQDFAKRDGSLIYCVDCGISDYEEIALAKELGIDVIVLDHHNPRSETLPEAFAIINPKVKADSYPFEGLAGCGVVSKLIWALCFAKTELYNQGYCFFYIDEAKKQLEIYQYINLLETGRFIYSLEEALPLAELEQELRGWPLFSYGLADQKPLIDQYLGSGAELHLVDLAVELCQDFPSLKGRSFDILRDKSRYARYRQSDADNGEAFLHLLSGLMLKRYSSHFDFYSKSLDLTAIGTLADLMPLQDENRILVRKGLTVLNRVERPALRELFIRQRILGKPIESSDVSWSISPWINSSGRMGQANVAVELFLSKDPSKQEELADTMHSLNQDRRKLGDSLWDDAIVEARSAFEEFDSKIVVIQDQPIPRGITGIMASKLVNAFKVPSIVISPLPDGKFSGSVRSPKGCPVKSMLNSLSELFIDFGGHDCAAGFSLEGAQLKPFIARLKQYCKTWDTQSKVEDIYEVDAEVPHKYLKPELWDMVSRLGPYGEGFRSIIFLSKALKVESCDPIGREPQNHLKFLLSTDNAKFPSFLWNGMEQFQEYMRPGNRVNVLYNVNRSFYMNKETLQITILDMEPAE